MHNIYIIIIKKVSKFNIKLPNEKSIYKQTTKHNNVMHFLVMKKQEISYFISNNVITKLSFLESKNQREIKEQSNQ